MKLDQHSWSRSTKSSQRSPRPTSDRLRLVESGVLILITNFFAPLSIDSNFATLMCGLGRITAILAVTKSQHSSASANADKDGQCGS